MKVAISCDHILSNSHCLTIVESFANLYKDAPIYTLAYRRGRSFGNIEIHPIKSTFLSNMNLDDKKLKNLSFLIPSASKQLTIPKEIDILINISSGLSQGIKLEGDTKVVTYLYDLPDFIKSDSPSLKSKFFRSYLQYWFKKSIVKNDLLICSSETLKNSLKDLLANLKDIDVLKPPVSVTGFPVITSERFKYDYFVLNINKVLTDADKKLAELLKSGSEKLYVVVRNIDINEVQKYFPKALVFENKIKGELAPLLAGSKALINFSVDHFCPMNLYSLAVGRPIITWDREIYKNFLPNRGVLYVDPYDVGPLKKTLTEAKENPFRFDAADLNKRAKSYNECKFKSLFLKKMASANISTPQ